MAKGQRVEGGRDQGTEGPRDQVGSDSIPRSLDPSIPSHIAGITLLPGYSIVGIAEKPTRRHVGYTLSALYSPWVKFGDLAYSWCVANGLPDQKWINGNLAEAWSPKGDKVDRESVMRLCISVPDAKVYGPQAEKLARSMGGYRLGEIPPDVLVLTGAIDLQRDRAYAEVVGWSERCQEAWLLWFTTVPCPHGDDAESFKQLEQLVNLRLPMDDPFGPRGVGASRWVIDSGDGVRTKTVYNFARRYPGRVFACKGMSGDMAAAARKTPLEKYPDGTVIPGGLTLFQVNTWKYKGEMLGRLKQKPVEMGQTGEARVHLSEAAAESAIVGGRWWWPDPDKDCLGRDVRAQLAEYFDQLTAEHLIVKNPQLVLKGREPEYGWVFKPGRTQNHFGDCRVYNAGIAEHEFGRLTRAYVEALRGGGAETKPGAVENQPRVSGRGNLDAIRERWKQR